MEQENNAAGAVNTPPVAQPTQPEVETNQPAPENIETINIPQSPASTPEEKNKKLFIIAIAAGVLAVAGLAFGIYGMTRPAKISNFTVQAKNDEGTVTELNKDKIDIDDKSNTITIPDTLSPLGISKELAASVVKPYLHDLGAFSDILNNKFNENNKIRIAFQNIDPQNLLLSTGDSFRVSYSDLNNMYKYLFGSDTNLEKKNYNNQTFLYVPGDNATSDYFLVYPGGYGGTGLTKFTAIKDAYFEDNKLIIEMYRENLSWCGIVIPEPDVCVDQQTWFSDNDFEAKQKIIEKFGNKLSVKKMYFGKDNGHYILESIVDVEKESDTIPDEEETTEEETTEEETTEEETKE